jgi:AraC-like DNA-binding protein
MTGLFLYVLTSLLFSLVAIGFHIKYKNAKFLVLYYINFLLLFSSFWISTDVRSYFSEGFYGILALLFFVFLILVPVLHFQLTLALQQSTKIIHAKNYFIPFVLFSINLFSIIFFQFVKNKTLFYYEIVENVMTFSNFIGLMFILPIMTIFYTITNFKLTKFKTPLFKNLYFYHLIFLPITIITWIFYKVIDNSITSIILVANILLLQIITFWLYLKQTLSKVNTIYNSIETIDKYQLIFNKLEEEMRKTKFYLKPDLSLKEIARLIKTNEKYLSHAINIYSGDNFSTYINKFRLNESKLMLANSDYDKYTIETISEMCGFKSKSVFNPLFKATFGIAPNDFRKF